MADHDEDRGTQKAEELIEVAANAVLKYAAERGVNLSKEEVEIFARQLIVNFVSITPPEKSTVTYHRLFTIKKGGLGGGKSVKPGNLLLEEFRGHNTNFVFSRRQLRLSFLDNLGRVTPSGSWSTVPLAGRIWELGIRDWGLARADPLVNFRL
jgi:hypothetical protein